MGEHVLHGDNEGRRSTLRNALANDPFYRRVKDAMLIILALAGASGMVGIDLGSMFRKVVTAPESKNDLREENRRRLSDHELSIRILETSMTSLDKKVDRMEDKIDRLLESRGIRP